MRRRDGEMRGLTFSISRLVEVERNAIRTHTLCLVVLRAPACIKPIPERLVRIAIEDFEAIASVLHRHNQLAAAAGRNRDRRGFDEFLGFREAGMPSALIVESPVVVAVFAEEPYRHGSSCF